MRAGHVSGVRALSVGDEVGRDDGTRPDPRIRSGRPQARRERMRLWSLHPKYSTHRAWWRCGERLSWRKPYCVVRPTAIGIIPWSASPPIDRRAWQ